MSDHEQMAMMSGSNQKNSLFKDKKARQSEGGAGGATSECDKEGLSLQRLKSKMSRKEFREIQQCAWLSGSQEMVELIFPEKVKGSDEKGRSGTVFSLKNLSELEGAMFFFDIIIKRFNSKSIPC